MRLIRLTSALLLLLLGALALFAGTSSSSSSPSFSSPSLLNWRRQSNHHMDSAPTIHHLSMTPSSKRDMWRDLVSVADSVTPLLVRLLNDHFFMHDDYTTNDYLILNNNSRIMTPKERLGRSADGLQSLNSPAALVATVALLMYMI